MEEKPKVKDVINYEQHIAPYRAFSLMAGVGAGKNEWTDTVLAKDKRVLVVTSRAAKVAEAKEFREKEARENGRDISKISESLDIYQLRDDSFFAECEDDKKAGYRVCHNWNVEKYIQYSYDPYNPDTHIWKYFDIIVFDEVHSLATDATFCDAPFYTQEFMKLAYGSQQTKIVTMTATPTAADELLPFANSKSLNKLDVREVCRHVQPDMLHFIPKTGALHYMAEAYEKKKDKPWHMVYFVTKLKHMKKIITFLKECGISEEVIAISFSKSDENIPFSKVLMDNKVRTEDCLTKNKTIPEDIKFFITTSRNKEGINIEDESCDWETIIESHWDIEMYQMWGRIRKNLRKVCIVRDAAQHMSVEINEDLIFEIECESVEIVNTAFKEWCNKKNIKARNKYRDKKAAAEIKRIHKRYRYLRYSIVRDEFVIYSGKYEGMKNFRESIKDFERVINDPNITISAGDTFMNIPYRIYDTRENQQLFEEYMKQMSYADGTVLTPKEQKEMLDYINNTMKLRSKDGTIYQTPGRAIRACGYWLEQVGKNVDRDNYGNVRLKKLN